MPTKGLITSVTTTNVKHLTKQKLRTTISYSRFATEIQNDLELPRRTRHNTQAHKRYLSHNLSVEVIMTTNVAKLYLNTHKHTHCYLHIKHKDCLHIQIKRNTHIECSMIETYHAYVKKTIHRKLEASPDWRVSNPIQSGWSRNRP